MEVSPREVPKRMQNYVAETEDQKRALASEDVPTILVSPSGTDVLNQSDDNMSNDLPSNARRNENVANKPEESKHEVASVQGVPTKAEETQPANPSPRTTEVSTHSLPLNTI